MSGTVFVLQGVSYAYQHVPALRDVSLRVRAGERIALLGANGSGKSTLLRLLDGLIFPHSGRVTAFGAELSEEYFAEDAAHYTFRRRVGLVFQQPDVQLFNPTVTDELAFGPLQLGWEKPRIRTAVAEMLQRFAIAPLAQRAPHRLSGGEKKRVALASVLILEPEVLLLDEPLAALDPPSREAMEAFLRAPGEGRTVIAATHDTERLGEIADRALLLQDGRLAAEGTVAEVLAAQVPNR